MDNLADLTFLGAGVPEGKFWTVGGKRRRLSDQMSSLPRNVVLTWKEITFSQFQRKMVTLVHVRRRTGFYLRLCMKVPISGNPINEANEIATLRE